MYKTQKKLISVREKISLFLNMYVIKYVFFFDVIICAFIFMCDSTVKNKKFQFQFHKTTTFPACF